MIKEKRFKDMNAVEFTKAKNYALNKTSSKFARFHMALNGYDLYFKGEKVCKWEVFAEGYTNANDILKCNSRISCVKRKKTSGYVN